MSKPRVSGRVWLHAWQMTAIGFGALFVAGLATPTAQLAMLAPVVAVAAAAVCLSVLASTQSLGMTTVACVGSLFAVGWLIFVHLVSVWSQVAVVSIIVAALVMTPLLAMALARHRQMIADEHAANDAARQAAELRKWTELLDGVNVSGP